MFLSTFIILSELFRCVHVFDDNWIMIMVVLNKTLYGSLLKSHLHFNLLIHDFLVIFKDEFCFQ